MLIIDNISLYAYSPSAWILKLTNTNPYAGSAFKVTIAAMDPITGMNWYYAGPSGWALDPISAGHAAFTTGDIDGSYVFDSNTTSVTGNAVTLHLNPAWESQLNPFPWNFRVGIWYAGTFNVSDNTYFTISSKTIPITSNGFFFHLVLVNAMGDFKLDIDLNSADQVNFLPDSFVPFIREGNGSTLPLAGDYFCQSGSGASYAAAGYPTSWDDADIDNKQIYKQITSLRQASDSDLKWGIVDKLSGPYWVGLYVKGWLNGNGPVYVETESIPLQIVTNTDARTQVLGEGNGQMYNAASTYYAHFWKGHRCLGIEWYPESYLTSYDSGSTYTNNISKFYAKHLTKHHAYDIVQFDGRIYDTGNASLRYIEQLRFQINEIEHKILRKSTFTSWTDSDKVNGVGMLANTCIWNNGMSYFEMNLVDNDNTSNLTYTQPDVVCYPKFIEGVIAAKIDGEPNADYGDNIGLPVGDTVGKVRWTYIKELREAIERIANELYGFEISIDDHHDLKWILGDTNIIKATERNNSSGSGIERGVKVWRYGTNFKVRNTSPSFKTTDGTILIGKGSHTSGEFDPWDNPDYPYDTTYGKMLVSVTYKWGWDGINPYYIRYSRDKTAGDPFLEEGRGFFKWNQDSSWDRMNSGGGVSTFCKWYDITSNDGTNISSDDLNAELASMDDGMGPAGENEIVMVVLVAAAPAPRESDKTRFNWVDWNFTVNGSNTFEFGTGKIEITQSDGVTLQPDLPIQWVPIQTRADQETYDYENTPDRITDPGDPEKPFNYPGYRAIWLEEIQIAINNIGSGYIPIIIDFDNQGFQNPDEVTYYPSGLSFGTFSYSHPTNDSDKWTTYNYDYTPPHEIEHYESYFDFPTTLNHKTCKLENKNLVGYFNPVDVTGSGSGNCSGGMFRYTGQNNLIYTYFHNNLAGTVTWEQCAYLQSMCRDDNQPVIPWTALLYQSWNSIWYSKVTTYI